jgi:hypothetical protein
LLSYSFFPRRNWFRSHEDHYKYWLSQHL